MPKSKKRNKRQSKPNRLNTITIRRSKETFLIDSRKVFIPEWMTEPDPIFESLYVKYLRGQISGFLTRMPTDMIKEGFYLPSRNLEYLCDAPPDEVVREHMLTIQQGARPTLHLYPNSNPNDNIRFLCPDDVASCIAYKRLNFGSVPAIVFSPGHQSLPFSSFKSKVSASAIGQGVRIYGLISVDAPSALPTIFGETLPSNPVDGLKMLSNELHKVVARLRLFHASCSGQLH
jgi:hypothetical protein